jgi:hypothetical protein
VTPAGPAGIWGKVDVVLGLAFARRLAGLLLVVALVAGLPLAAARASCVCAHGHQHGAATTAAAAAHTCTPACTAATCPMHRPAGSSHARDSSGATRAVDAMRCGCAGEAQALIGQASVAGVLPGLVTVEAPALARVSLPSVAESPLSLAPAPPAPPPRA